MTPKLYRIGETVPKSAQYNIVDSMGQISRFQVTGVAGKTFPPYHYPIMGYVLTDMTVHMR